MRILVFFFILLILVQISLAETKLNQGQEITVGDHIVKVVSVGANNVIISVDGVKDIFGINEPQILNGVNIEVTAIFYVEEPSDRYINLDLDEEIISEGTAETSVCGDNKCEQELDENEDNCCKDCGCNSGFSCLNNKCVENECNSDKECWDIINRDFCMNYKCEGAPKKCTQTPITECVVNDRCCPSACIYPDDPDCPSSKKQVGGESVSSGSKNDTLPISQNIAGESLFKRLFNSIKGLLGKIF